MKYEFVYYTAEEISNIALSKNISSEFLTKFPNANLHSITKLGPEGEYVSYPVKSEHPAVCLSYGCNIVSVRYYIEVYVGGKVILEHAPGNICLDPNFKNKCHEYNDYYY